MHSFRETRIIPYNADLIYQIVMDIEKYPEFLPWCDSVTILHQDDCHLTANVKMSFKVFTESYVCKVVGTKKDHGYLIEVEAISGPFSHLKNVWAIKSMNNLSEVEFFIDFKLKSKILDIVIGKVFSSATEKMIAAFESRAKKLSHDLFLS